MDIKEILAEIGKVLILFVSILIVAYVLFVLAFYCASDPQLHNTAQNISCAIINPLGVIFIFGSPIIAILTYFIMLKKKKSSWKQIGKFSIAFLILALILFIFSIVLRS